MDAIPTQALDRPDFTYGNFWTRASTPRKVAYAAAAVAAVGGTWALIRWVRKPDPFSSVTPQCNDFALANQAEVDSALRPIVRDAANRGAVDPFAVTTLFVNRYASECRSYPETVRNPGEAELYLVAFQQTLRVMAEERLVSPEQMAYFLEMVSVWAQSQGLPANKVPVSPPPTADAAVFDAETR